jgi:hypothetical protein
MRTCQFCKKSARLYLCRLYGDVYVRHLFKACLECIGKMGLVIIAEVENDDGKERMETPSS